MLIEARALSLSALQFLLIWPGNQQGMLNKPFKVNPLSSGLLNRR